MADYKPVFSTPEQIDEINKLCDDGHGEALLAFGLDCANAYKESLNRYLWKVAGISAAVGVVCGVIQAAVQVHKERKKLEEHKPKLIVFNRYKPMEEES